MMEIESKTLESDRNENCAIKSLPPPPSSSPKSSSLLNSLSFSSYEEEDDQKESKYTSESDFDSSTKDDEIEHARDVETMNGDVKWMDKKRGKVLAESSNVKLDARRRSFKRRDGVDDNHTETNPEKVILKHQDL
ncbi:hypothetical protein FEM48_Zijuj11G0041400 [Ziziphus jujuba var. spinosa]|uniref:Uncharacterized protein n=1 Tax=Ziziphus jujuba var. spinosa TaxID=714518 RepID=A0A978UGR1_ZIZJJ|nr:hypothetical protein FEM48_Zijuj11G0041400 [Ziziphus jujuba var. spinosa]